MRMSGREGNWGYVDGVLIVGTWPEGEQINSIPTLLSFSRGEAQLGTKVTSVEEMKDREFLRRWIREEARRGGKGGARSGGGGGGGLFGKLFGLGKS